VEAAVVVSVARVSRIAAAAAVAIGLTGCGDDKDRTTTAVKNGVVEYVGTVDGVASTAKAASGDYFVALAVGESGAVSAYACDGEGNAQRFTGRLDGESIAAESDGGDATLAATVSGKGVRGKLVIDGETLGFAASAATGVGGLYTFTAADGRLSARSEGGSRLVAQASPEDPGTVNATVTRPDGKRLPLDVDQSRDRKRAYDAIRMVLLDNGEGRGNKTSGASKITNGGVPWINPDIDP
jgi:hypothetical protein